MYRVTIQRIILLVSLISCGFLLAEEAKQYPKLKVVTEEGYPINYTSKETGEITGFAAEYLHYVLKQSDIDYSMASYTWTRAFKIASNEPNVLIFSMARTPAREDNFFWLDDIISLRYSLYGPAKHADKFNGVVNFRPYRVAVVAGSVTHGYMKDDGYTNIVLVKDYEQLNNVIRRGRVDLIASSKFAMEHFGDKFSYEPNFFAPYEDLNYVSINLYYAMSKGSDPRLVEQLKAELKKHKTRLIIPE